MDLISVLIIVFIVALIWLLVMPRHHNHQKKINKKSEVKETTQYPDPEDVDFTTIAKMGGINLKKENNDTINEFVDPQYLLPDNIRVQSGDKPFPASSVSYTALGTTNLDKAIENDMFAVMRVEGLPDPGKSFTPMQHNPWAGDIATIPRQSVSIPVRADIQINSKINADWNALSS